MEKNHNETFQTESDCVIGTVLIGVREPVPSSCASDKPPGYETFVDPETICYKSLNEKVSGNFTF